MKKILVEPSSFRDPSGFLYKSDGILFRQINNSYKDDYEQLMSSGLYDDLITQELMVPYEEVYLVFRPYNLSNAEKMEIFN